jgi:hypothetical protein
VATDIARSRRRHGVELGVAAGCVAVVTYNVRDFRGTDRCGIEVWTPVDLLRKVGLLS